jgi:hypothetical protein
MDLSGIACVSPPAVAEIEPLSCDLGMAPGAVFQHLLKYPARTAGGTPENLQTMQPGFNECRSA